MLALLLVAPAHAADCPVPGTYASIQAAVDDVGCESVSVAAGVFSDPVSVNRDLLIQGAGQGITIIGDTVTVASDATLSLNSLSIQGAGGAGILLDSKFAVLRGDDLEISFNGGFGVAHGPTATDALADLRNCLISDNQRGVDAQRLQMDSCTVLLNVPQGGIVVGLIGHISNSSIVANQNTQASGDGGGILFDGPGGTLLEVEDSFILGNVANSGLSATNTSDGGGIMNRRGFLTIRRSVISGNLAGRYGGGVANSDSSGANVTIFDSVIDLNDALGAGGGVGGGDRMEIYHSTVNGNRAVLDSTQNANGLASGGGIYQFGDRLILVDSRVINNRAGNAGGPGSADDGGGVYLATNQPTVIQRSSILDNRAEGDGGGVYVASPTSMENVTLSGNQAAGDGGGIYGSVAPTIAHGTIVDNTAGGDGGGIAEGGSLDHTVIGHNADTSAADFHPDCSGGVVSVGFSLLRIKEGCPAFDGGPKNDSGSAASPLALGLVRPASDNGGPVETVALTVESPAVDAGNGRCADAVSTDARGFSRFTQDGNNRTGDDDLCDLGAYEIFSGCQAEPLLLRDFVFDHVDTIVSETRLETAPDVEIGSNGKVRFVAGDDVGLGTGFSVNPGGSLAIDVGGVSCP